MDNRAKVISKLEEAGYIVDKFTGAVLVPYRISEPVNLLMDLNKVKSIISSTN